MDRTQGDAEIKPTADQNGTEESAEDQAADTLAKFIAQTNARLEALEKDSSTDALAALAVRLTALEAAAPPDASAVVKLAEDFDALAKRTEHFITRVRSLL